MGYRELLKKYIRHLELCAGDNYIEAENREPILSKRDLGELRTLAGEIARDAYEGREVNRIDNFNYRLRVLMNRHNLSAATVAMLAQVDTEIVRAWRTAPKSSRYRQMQSEEFSRFETALIDWLETE